MLDTKQIVIDGITFQLHPLPILSAAKLDKRVVSLLAPVLGTVKSLDDEIDLGKVIDVVMEALSNLSDSDYEQFIIDLCSTVICVVPGQPPTEVTSQKINEIFKGSLKTLYKLMYEIMRYNKFTPFELMAGGNVNQIMSIFKEDEKIMNGSGKELEKLEN